MPDPTGTGAEERRWTLWRYRDGVAAMHQDGGWNLGDRPDHPNVEKVDAVPASDLAALQERLEEILSDPAYVTAAKERGRAMEMERQRDELRGRLERLGEVEGGKASWKRVAADLRAERDSLALEAERLRSALEIVRDDGGNCSEVARAALLRRDG
jgi:hypothetical protein